jgi:hypothetical protein
MKYLHIISSDQFYSKEFIDLIESNLDINDHQFIIFRKKNKKYIKSEDYKNIKILNIKHFFIIKNLVKLSKFKISHIKYFIIYFLKIRYLMNQAEYIFIHYLTNEISILLLNFTSKAKIFWVMWGNDLYKYLPLKLFDQETFQLLKRFKNNLKSMFFKFTHALYLEIRKKAIKKIDFIINTHRGDLKLLKKYFKTNIKWFPNAIYPNPVPFGRLDRMEYNSIDVKFSFSNNTQKLILLGNSGAPTNNHLDILLYLSKIKDQNFKIICPLSIGAPKYIREVIKEGKKLFGEKFIPLVNFLEPKIYYELLKKIDLAVMCHNRQQGVGTLSILLYLGTPICMKKNTTYFYFLDKGIKLFTIEQIEKLISNEIKLDKNDLKKNKEVILENRSLESVRSSLIELFESLEKKGDIPKKYH